MQLLRLFLAKLMKGCITVSVQTRRLLIALAWKELKAQKITAILILVAVIMSTIMTTVIGQSIGINGVLPIKIVSPTSYRRSSSCSFCACFLPS